MQIGRFKNLRRITLNKSAAIIDRRRMEGGLALSSVEVCIESRSIHVARCRQESCATVGHESHVVDLVGKAATGIRNASGRITTTFAAICLELRVP